MTHPLLRLTLLRESFAVCRLAPDAVVPAPAGSSFWSVTRTADEISVVCEERCAPPAARIEAGWVALRIDGPLDFSEIGIIAGISRILADAEISIFVISTFDTDYILVKRKRVGATIEALESAGHQVWKA